MYGVVLQAADARAAVEQIVLADRLGVPAGWAISSGLGGADVASVFMAALGRTEQIVLGTAILRTWTRHPICFADEIVAFEQLHPGRYRLGIGQTGRQSITMYGANYSRPLTHVREYVTAIKAYLAGEVAMTGHSVTANASNPNPFPDAPVIMAAAGLRAFESAGELADGALSWVAPLRYLRDQALPALQAGAAKASRPVPPLIAHVPVALTSDRRSARELVRRHLGGYAQAPFFKAQWALDGRDPELGWTDDLIDDVLVSGDEDAVADGLRSWRRAGMDELYVQPLSDLEDRPRHDAQLLELLAALAAE